MTKKSRKQRIPSKTKKSTQTNILARNIKKILTGATILAVLGIITGVFPNPVRDFYYEITGKPLEINPSQKDISFSADGNNWNEEFFAYLINKTSNSYYDIDITSEFPNPIDVSIFPVDSDEFSTINAGNGTISVGSDFMISGENEEGNKIIETFINNIGPGETKKIKVEINKKDYTQNFRLELKVGGFNKIPKPIFSK